MTRAYISIRPSDSDNYLTWYFNGDQYPTGVWKFFGFEELLTPMTTKQVKSFYKRQYANKPDGVSPSGIVCPWNKPTAIQEATEPMYDQATDYNWRFDYRNPYTSKPFKNKPYLEVEAYSWEQQILNVVDCANLKENQARVRAWFKTGLATV